MFLSKTDKLNFLGLIMNNNVNPTLNILTFEL